MLYTAAAASHHRRRILLGDGTESQTPDEGQSEFTADDYDIAANGSATASFTVTARNADGNPLAGLAVVLTGETIAVSAANTLVTVYPDEAENDGVESITITVQVKDASGRPIPNIPASDITLAATGTGNTLTQPTGSTNQAGVITGAIVSTVAAAKTISATVRGTAITDTATATFSVAPAPAGFSNEPVGFTMLGDWNDEATLETGGWATNGSSPNATSLGFKSRVTSGYVGTPALGGSAVIRSHYDAGATGGYGPGRLEWSFPAGTDEFFIGTETQFAAGFPGSDNSNKIFFVIFAGGTGRTFLGYQERKADRVNYCHFQVSTTGFTYTGGSNQGSIDIVDLYGTWMKTEWYLKRNTTPGSADGIIRVWVNGVLDIEMTGVTFPTGAASQFYDEGENNGNRWETGAAPEVRTISTEYPGAPTEGNRYTSRLYVSAP